MQIVHTDIWPQGSVAAHQVALSPHSKKKSYFFSGVCGFCPETDYSVKSHEITLSMNVRGSDFLMLCPVMMRWSACDDSLLLSPTMPWCRTDFLYLYWLHITLSSLWSKLSLNFKWISFHISGKGKRQIYDSDAVQLLSSLVKAMAEWC